MGRSIGLEIGDDRDIPGCVAGSLLPVARSACTGVMQRVLSGIQDFSGNGRLYGTALLLLWAISPGACGCMLLHHRAQHRKMPSP